MSSVFGGPKFTATPPPNPLFPGIQSSYTQQLQQSGIGPASFGTLTQAATTGLPTDVGPAFEALKASMQHTQDEGAANLKEQFGAQGLTTAGSDLQLAASDYETNSTTQMNNTLAQYQLQSSEAAANRQVAAAGAGAGLEGELATAFTPAGVVSNQPGILGGAMSLFSTLFPGFDLSQMGQGAGAVFGAGAT